VSVSLKLSDAKFGFGYSLHMKAFFNTCIMLMVQYLS